MPPLQPGRPERRHGGGGDRPRRPHPGLTSRSDSPKARLAPCARRGTWSNSPEINHDSLMAPIIDWIRTQRKKRNLDLLGMDATALEDLLYKRSGLLGVSKISYGKRCALGTQ